MGRLRRYYAARGFDWSTLTNPEKDVLLPAMDALRFPTGRIKQRAGQKVPISVADLSRFAASMDANGHGHAHEGGAHAHLLGEPIPEENSYEQAGRRRAPLTLRRAPLGLYWLPTAEYPAGRIEVGAGAMSDPDLAREVLLAEAAHAVDYGAMTDSQRERISAVFDWTERPDKQVPVGWFEELGEGDYWRWRGERWMGLFMAAFAPELPRPLEARQPWEWTFDESDIRAVRRILRRPGS